ncbi:hypothetical protein PybrP1_006146 [[Pythium] brassicae (nom. inval.)]|nr:hypothetical protein PybrP1_006146 [[Pythium] brassicae (nom. inval.)]
MDGVQDGAVRALAEYIAAPAFQRHFEQFFLDHALTFTDEREHRLDYMDIYRAPWYETESECGGRCAAFLASVELSEDAFAQRCQQAITSDPRAEQYLEVVIASMDYDAFYVLMKSMRSRASLDRLQADAKARGGGDDGGDDADDAEDDDPKRTAAAAAMAAVVRTPSAAGSASRSGRDDDAVSDSKDGGGDARLAVRGLGIRDDDEEELKSAKSSAIDGGEKEIK